MADWSLKDILSGLHDDIQQRLQIARQSFQHPGTKGDASEKVWLELLNKYLPTRYRADKAHVVDSEGKFSDQIDIVIYDRQYSPFIFNFEGEIIIPAESVYAVFEAKQSINLAQIGYAQDKVESVRRLHRTSLPIPHAGGTFPAKALNPIIGGLLTLESEWNPAMGESMHTALLNGTVDNRLNMGCIAAHGHYTYNPDIGDYNFYREGKPATAFLLWLISQLQFSGTVPMIDVQAYSSWLSR